MGKGYIITYNKLYNHCKNRFKYDHEYYHRCSYGRIKNMYRFNKCSEKLCPILKSLAYIEGSTIHHDYLKSKTKNT